MGNLFIDVMKDAKKEKTAVASINILNYTTTRGIIEAAANANRDVILQPSTSTVKEYGIQPIYDMVQILKKNAKTRVALHLDHCRDTAIALGCVDAGWDSVMMDFSALPIEENIRRTKEVVDYAHARGVTVEGEIGVISGVEDDISSDKTVAANYDDTVDFIERSGIDAIAPAIGTAHGVYKHAPKLNWELIEQVGKLDVPLVVHGGTGLSEETFHRLIALGAAKINISTALKNIYLGTSKKLLENKIAPVPFDVAVYEACRDEMEKYIRLFAGEDIKL